MAIPRGAKFLVLIGILIFFAGCFREGKPFDEQLFPRIKEGKTTKLEVQEWLGTPYQKGIEGGLETWSYYYLEGAVGRERYSKELKVWFDEKGVVKSVSYTTNYAPWQVVR